MPVRLWVSGLIFLLSLLGNLGCVSQPPEKAGEPVGFEKVPGEELPGFCDDLDPDSLRRALEKSLRYYGRIPPDRVFKLGDRELRASVLKETLVRFLELLDAGELNPAGIARSFDVYRVRFEGSPGQSLVTGYYEPVLDGRLAPDPRFCYALYGLPPDLITIDLSTFDSARFSGERLIGRLSGNRVIPYYTRSEIEGQRVLDPFGNQLAWLQDVVDVFFLHVQGSGIIRLPGNRDQRIGYAGANGRPYRSIGKYLREKGLLTGEITLQSIRTYLRANPDRVQEVLWHNESYVFFRWVDEGPLGSINVPLTAGRSVAMDSRIHPAGAVLYLESQQPQFDTRGNVLRWEPLCRWVVNQDTGGAIKGFGRVDLFCGSGEAAERIAGRLQHPGKVYFLLTKEIPQG